MISPTTTLDRYRLKKVFLLVFFYFCCFFPLPPSFLPLSNQSQFKQNLRKIFDCLHIYSYYLIFLSRKCHGSDLRFSLKYIHKTQMSGLSCPKSCGENPRQMLLLSFDLILNSRLFSLTPAGLKIKSLVFVDDKNSRNQPDGNNRKRKIHLLLL